MLDLIRRWFIQPDPHDVEGWPCELHCRLDVLLRRKARMGQLAFWAWWNRGGA